MPVLRSVRSAIAKAVRRAIGVITDTLYSVAGEKPPLVADYVEEYYRGINVASFSDTISHTRTTNATMTDGYGPELIPNGEFFTSTEGWTAYSANIWAADGLLHVEDDGGYSSAYTTITTVPGKTYIFTAKCHSKPSTHSAYLEADATGTNNSVWSNILPITEVSGSEGVYSLVFVASTTTTYVRVRNDGINNFTSWDHISVREMPVIKWAPHNYLKHSEDVRQWTSTGSVALSATEFREDTSTGDHRLQQGLSTQIVIGETYTIAAEAKSGEGTRNLGFRGFGEGGNYPVFNLISGTIEHNGTNWSNVSITPVGDGYFLCKATVTATGAFTPYFHLINGTGPGDHSYTGDGTSSIHLRKFRVYRSDLGGMVNNPDKSGYDADYVPSVAREVTGIELLANGSFPTNGDTTGWITMSASAAVVNNQLVVTDDGLDSIGGRAYYVVATEIGKRYKVSYDKISSVANGASVYASVDTSYGTNLGGGYTAAGGHSRYFTFVATTTTSNILAVTGSLTGGTATFDNFSVKEVVGNPGDAQWAARRNHHRFNGTEWVNEGLLHETSTSTNIFHYSGDFTNSYWAKSSVSVTGGYTAPDGTASAVRIIEDTTNGARHVTKGGGILSNSTEYVFSVYLKAGSRTKAKINVFTGNASHTATFDLEAGTVNSVVAAAKAYIENVGHGWHRCSISTTTASTGNPNVAFGPLDDTYSTTYQGDGTSFISGWGAQLEEGTTPGSYIPTDSTSKTRNQDQLTIFSSNLPWPEPEYLSGELVANGTFDTLDNWSNGNGGVSSLVTRNGSSTLRVTATSTLQGYARQNVTMSPGKVYHVSCYLHAEVNCAAILVFQRDLRQTVVPYVSLVPGHNEFYLEIDGASNSTYLQLQVGGAPTNGSYLEVDNLSVKEMKPLAISIAMKGKVNFTDQDSYNTITFWRWYQNTSNNLNMSITTNGTYEGRYIAIQEHNNVYNQVSTNIDVMEPGINVPFSTACRYTTNEQRMAEQGILYPANTSLTHLPDLSALNFDLARAYNGTIKNFRIWAENIGDTGLVDATKPSTETALDVSFDTQSLSSIDRGVGY